MPVDVEDNDAKAFGWVFVDLARSALASVVHRARAGSE